MKRNPAGAGYDGNPRRRLRIAAGETRLMGLSSYSASRPNSKVVSAPCDSRKSTYYPAESVAFARLADLGSTAYLWAKWAKNGRNWRNPVTDGGGEP